MAEKGSPRKRKAETESVPEGQPSAKEAKLAVQQAEKAEKEAAKEAKKAEKQKKSDLVKNAPTRPGGTAKAHFASKQKSDNASITLKEVNAMYAKLTDDAKRDLKIEWKKATNEYFTKMKTYLDQLPLEERSHVESKLKLKATGFNYQSLSINELFPNRPKPPTNLRFFFNAEYKEKIKAKFDAEFEKGKSESRLILQQRISGEMFSELTEKEMKKLKKKHKKAEEKYAVDHVEFYQNLTDQQQCDYDRIQMKKSKQSTPQWLLDEPTFAASVYSFYSTKMREKNEDEWKDKKMPEVSKLIAQTWKTLGAAKQQKTREKFAKVFFENY